MPRALPLLTAVAALVFLTGSWWGVPDHLTWAPDELLPSDVRAAVDARFAGGWASIYPPLHYAVLAALYIPLERLASAIGADTLQITGILTMTGRLVSVAMALGILPLLHRITTERTTSPWSGVLAAAIFAVALPVTFYAKTANLDIAYTFWLVVALLFYARTFRSREPRNFYWFTVAGMAAVCTKDQAYGFFVLPAAYMGLGALLVAARGRELPGVPPRHVLALMVVAGLATFAVFFNLPFNASGFVEHVRMISGPYSENYRMFSPTLPGQAQLAWATFVEFGRALGWPLALLVLAGISSAVLRREPAAMHLLLPALSYYLFFIAVVGYVYDRFLLGLIAILAVAAAPTVDAWTRAASGWRLTWRSATVAAALVYALGRAVSLDYLMIRDSRYDVERWVRGNARPDAVVVAIGRPEHLPRRSQVDWTELRPHLELLARARPDVVIVNAAFSRRAEPGSPAAEFYEALRSGTAGYRAADTFRTPRTGLPLAFEDRFTRVAEDPFSNLSKINPLMEIYVRR